MVTGVSAGTTTIWAKGKEYKKCLVTVLKTSPKEVASPGEVLLNVGQSAQLKNGTKIASYWETDNAKIATVSSSGLVKAISRGETNVWGYFDGSPKRYFIKVN